MLSGVEVVSSGSDARSWPLLLRSALVSSNWLMSGSCEAIEAIPEVSEVHTLAIIPLTWLVEKRRRYGHCPNFCSVFLFFTKKL